MKLKRIFAGVAAAAMAVTTLTAISASAEDYLYSWEIDCDSVGDFDGENWGSYVPGTYTVQLSDYLTAEEIAAVANVKVYTDGNVNGNVGVAANVNGAWKDGQYNMASGEDSNSEAIYYDENNNWAVTGRGTDWLLGMDDGNVNFECWYMDYNATSWVNEPEGSSTWNPVWGGTSTFGITGIEFLDSENKALLTLPQPASDVTTLEIGKSYVQRNLTTPTTIRVMSIVDKTAAEDAVGATVTVTAGGKSLAVPTNTYYTGIADEAYELEDGGVIIAVVIENVPESLALSEFSIGCDLESGSANG